MTHPHRCHRDEIISVVRITSQVLMLLRKHFVQINSELAFAYVEGTRLNWTWMFYKPSWYIVSLFASLLLSGPEPDLRPRAVRSSACQEHTNLHKRMDAVEKVPFPNRHNQHSVVWNHEGLGCVFSVLSASLLNVRFLSIWACQKNPQHFLSRITCEQSLPHCGIGTFPKCWRVAHPHLTNLRLPLPSPLYLFWPTLLFIWISDWLIHGWWFYNSCYKLIMYYWYVNHTNASPVVCRKWRTQWRSWRWSSLLCWTPLKPQGGAHCWTVQETQLWTSWKTLGRGATL